MLDLLSSLPAALASDPLIIALCGAIEPELDAIKAANLDLSINPAAQPPAVIDRLAADRHLTAGEGYKMAATPQQKAAMVKAAVNLHRTKGTPAAVKNAVAALEIGINLFDRNQRPALAPFTFAVEITDPGPRPYTAETWADLYATIAEFKPARAHVAAVNGLLTAGAQAPRLAGAVYGVAILTIKQS